jgi:hypothetical protein
MLLLMRGGLGHRHLFWLLQRLSSSPWTMMPKLLQQVWQQVMPRQMKPQLSSSSMVRQMLRASYTGRQGMKRLLHTQHVLVQQQATSGMWKLKLAVVMLQQLMVVSQQPSVASRM